LAVFARIIAAFGRRPGGEWERFRARFAGRTVIVHAGLTPGWVEELLKEGGGAGRFRFDVRPAPGRRPTPIEWLVHTQLLPLGLPVPFLFRVEADGVRLRHLVRNGTPVHPSEIAWMLRELDTRYHAFVHFSGKSRRVTRGMSERDNAVRFDI
jgi:hypothetical protein